MRRRIILVFSTILSIIGVVISVKFFKAIGQEYTYGGTPVMMAETGQVGDFIGGVVGTILSFVGVLLLFETLALQRKEFNSSNKVFLHQQFDNTFFELLNLHKENLKNFKTIDLLGEIKEGREFFIYQKEYLQDVYSWTSNLSKNKKNAVDLFRIFYVNFEEDFSVYFKTLYQIYSLIENSDISGDVKASYSKILRAQLSGAELFFIRYNAMTESGNQSSHYINMFNITKHLSHFELLEFKYWWSQLSKFERNGLSTIIKDIKSVLKLFLLDEKVNHLEKSFKKGKYKLIMTSSKRSQFDFEVVIDNSKNSTEPSIIDGISKFSINDIENLFKCIFKEFIIYSNFNKFNNIRILKIDKVVTSATNIKISVKTTDDSLIKIHYWYK